MILSPILAAVLAQLAEIESCPWFLVRRCVSEKAGERQKKNGPLQLSASSVMKRSDLTFFFNCRRNTPHIGDIVHRERGGKKDT